MRHLLRLLVLLSLVLAPASQAELIHGPVTIIGGINHGPSTTGTDAYVVTLDPVPTTFAYTANMIYSFTADVANTGAATVNFNGAGAKTIVKTHDGTTTALLDGDIRAGKRVLLIYDGTNMQCQNCDGNVVPILEFDQENLPTTCRPNRDMVSLTDATDDACQVQRCNSTGTGWKCIGSLGSGAVQPATTGLRTSPTEILSSRYAVTEMSGTQSLCVHYRVNVTVGTTGANISLPSAADNNCGGEFKLIITDTGTGSLIVTPNGTDTILVGETETNQPYPPITGKNNSLYIERVSSTGWRIEEISGVGTGSVVMTGQDNAFSTGAQDFTATSALRVRSAAGCAPTSDASICFDTDSDVYVGGGQGITGRFPRVWAITRPSQTLTNSTTSDQDFTSVGTIPASYLVAGRALEVNLTLQFVTDGAPVSQTWYLKLGTTKVLTFPAFTPSTASSTRSWGVKFLIQGTAAAGASVAVDTNSMGIPGPGSSGQGVNTTTQPVNLATNGTLAIVPGLAFGGSGGGESATVFGVVIKEY